VLEAGGNANAQINNAKESSAASNSSSASKKKSKNKKKLSNSSISSSVSANGGLGSGVINPFVNAPAQHLHTQPSPQASSHSQLEEDARLAWQLQQQMQTGQSEAVQREQWAKVGSKKLERRPPAQTSPPPLARTSSARAPVHRSPSNTAVGSFALLRGDDEPEDEDEEDEEDGDEESTHGDDDGGVLGMELSEPFWSPDCENPRLGGWFVKLVGASGAQVLFQIGSVVHRCRKLDKGTAPQLLMIEKQTIVKEYRRQRKEEKKKEGKPAGMKKKKKSKATKKEIDVSKSAAESDYSTSVTRPGRASFEHNYDPPAPEPEFTAVASKSKKGNKSRENVTKLVFGGSHGSSTTNYYMVPGPEPKAAPTSMGGISLSNAPAMATPTHSVYAQQQLQQVPQHAQQQSVPQQKQHAPAPHRAPSPVPHHQPPPVTHSAPRQLPPHMQPPTPQQKAMLSPHAPSQQQPQQQQQQFDQYQTMTPFGQAPAPTVPKPVFQQQQQQPQPHQLSRGVTQGGWEAAASPVRSRPPPTNPGIPPQPQQIDPYSADASQHHGFVAPAQEPGFNASSRDEARYSNFSSPYSHPTDAVMGGSARSRSPHHAFPSAPPGMPASTPTHSHHPSEEDMLPPHLAALLEPFPPQAAPQAAPAASSYNPNPSNGLYQAFGGGMTSAQMFSQQGLYGSDIFRSASPSSSIPYPLAPHAQHTAGNDRASAEFFAHLPPQIQQMAAQMSANTNWNQPANSQEQLDSMMGMSGMNNIFGYEDSSPGGARPPPGFDLNDSKKNVYRPPPLRAQAAAAAAHRAAQEGSLAPPSRPQRQHQ